MCDVGGRVGREMVKERRKDWGKKRNKKDGQGEKRQ